MAPRAREAPQGLPLGPQPEVRGRRGRRGVSGRARRTELAAGPGGVAVTVRVAVRSCLAIPIAVAVADGGSGDGGALVVRAVLVPAHRERPRELGRVEVILSREELRDAVRARAALARAVDDLEAVVAPRDGLVEGQPLEEARHAQVELALVCSCGAQGG